MKYSKLLFTFFNLNGARFGLKIGNSNFFLTPSLLAACYLLWFCFFGNPSLAGSAGGCRMLIRPHIGLPSLPQCFRQFSFTFRDGSGKIGKQEK